MHVDQHTEQHAEHDHAVDEMFAVKEVIGAHGGERGSGFGPPPRLAAEDAANCTAPPRLAAEDAANCTVRAADEHR
jgi:hypothetical protein